MNKFKLIKFTLYGSRQNYIYQTSNDKTYSFFKICIFTFTAPFNNMRTLKFKAQPTNVFFATVNQIFAGSSQHSTAAERAVIKSLCTVQTTNRVRQ